MHKSVTKRSKQFTGKCNNMKKKLKAQLRVKYVFFKEMLLFSFFLIE